VRSGMTSGPASMTEEEVDRDFWNLVRQTFKKVTWTLGLYFIIKSNIKIYEMFTIICFPKLSK
jgi:hypothetical protein